VRWSAFAREPTLHRVLPVASPAPRPHSPAKLRRYLPILQPECERVIPSPMLLILWTTRTRVLPLGHFIPSFRSCHSARSAKQTRWLFPACTNNFFLSLSLSLSLLLSRRLAPTRTARPRLHPLSFSATATSIGGLYVRSVLFFFQLCHVRPSGASGTSIPVPVRVAGNARCCRVEYLVYSPHVSGKTDGWTDTINANSLHDTTCCACLVR